MTTKRRGIEIVGRRAFLRGAAGVVLALPLLESIGHEKVAKADVGGFKFAVFFRVGNGVQQGRYQMEPDRFWPTKLGALTTGMKADGDQAVNVLSDYASKLLLVRGCQADDEMVDVGCGHSRGGLLCLTSAKPDGLNKEKALALGESIDNRIVRELQGKGVEPLTLHAGQRSSYLDDVLSYRAASDRRTGEANPYNAYVALFGLPDQTAADQAKLATRRKSVNDFVRAEMKALLANPALSKDDRYRVDQHFQAIHDLEQQMVCSLPASMLGPISKVTDKLAIDADQTLTIAAMQTQVIALAMACGRVRAATLQIGNGNDGTQYTINGTKLESFHHISHRIQSDGATGTPIPNADVLHHEIDKMMAGVFKGLLDQLSSYKTPTGTLLDDGIAVWLNDLATGPPHSTDNLPYVCAGSLGGTLKNGVYVEAADVTKNKFVSHNLFLNTIGAGVGCKNAAGAPLDDFGDPSLPKGNIPQMLV
jgi:hypothetical protein